MKQRNQYSPYWPGTNIVKSQSNAFCWKGKESQILKQAEHKNMNIFAKQKISLERK